MAAKKAGPIFPNDIIDMGTMQNMNVLASENAAMANALQQAVMIYQLAGSPDYTLTPDLVPEEYWRKNFDE